MCCQLNLDNQDELNTSCSCTQYMRNSLGLLTLFNRTRFPGLMIYIFRNYQQNKAILLYAVRIFF